MRKKLFIVILIIKSVIVQAQDNLGDSINYNNKSKSYFSANLNARAIIGTPILCLNPLIEYNYKKYSFYAGPVLSRNLDINIYYLQRNCKTFTIPGFTAGTKVILVESLFNRFSVAIHLNGGFMKFNDKGISDYKLGGNWIDGYYHNSYTLLFCEVSTGFSYKFSDNLFVEINMGFGRKFYNQKYNYVAYKSERGFLYSIMYSPQININYKLNKT